MNYLTRSEHGGSRYTALGPPLRSASECRQGRHHHSLVVQLMYNQLNNSFSPPQHSSPIHSRASDTSAMATASHLLRLRPTAFKPLTNLLTSQQACSYHSYNHPPPPGPFGEVETAILSTAVPLIPDHGFTPETLHLGAQKAGYLDVSTNLFPSGAFSLVHYYLYTQREALQKRTSIINHSIEAGKQAPGVGQKVKALTWARLMANEPVIHKLPEALALMSLAGNIHPSLKELSALSDEIWFLAGDVSVNSSWYTKQIGRASCRERVF